MRGVGTSSTVSRRLLRIARCRPTRIPAPSSPPTPRIGGRVVRTAQALVASTLSCCCAVGASAGQATAQPPPGTSGQTVVDPTVLNNRGIEEAKAGRFETGAALVRQAVQLAPSDQQFQRNLSGILTDWAVRLQDEGQSERAESLLQEALEHDANNGKALVLLGNAAALKHDGLSSAIELWTRAFSTLPPGERQSLSDRIERAQRDLAIERSFTNHRTAHFVIRFESSDFAEQAATLGQLLEAAYDRLATSLGSGPGDLVVLLYTRGNFERIAGRRDWALGLYDGRIRLRIEELSNPSIPDVLAHELTHAWLAEGFGPRVPTWIHEGFAQYEEPDQHVTARRQQLLQGIVDRTAWVPLKWIDRHFEQPSNMEDVERAYLQARWAVSELIRRRGSDHFRQFLEQLAAGKPIDRAFDEAFTPSRWVRFDQGSLD